ncbi:MAG: TldD/PmbA family protein [Bdellovibrionales bacterium]|jgi:PmbA protein|nr:TldD/PmbA family protein [Bdellovibrionales bacterium]
MTSLVNPDMLNLMQDLLKTAKGFGATAADAVLADSTSVAVARRLGKAESLSRSEEAEVGLRVLVGQRQAIVSSSDKSPEALRLMAERAVAMARAVPEDAYAGIADADQLATSFPELDMYDDTQMSVEQMIDLADKAEDAARAVAGVTNSEGAECSTGSDAVYYAASNGFAQGYAGSGFSLSVSVIAGRDMAMETDYEYDSVTFLSDLKDAADIGRAAGERAVAAVNPRKGKTKQVPVVFDRRVSGGMIGSLAGAISGGAVARGTTFLKDKMGQQIYAPDIQVVDDPFMKRGMRSHPFDAEGIAPTRRNIIENGVLTGWLLDLASARQLGLQTTGNAARGASSPPSPRASNFYMLPGRLSVDELIADISEGFFVTQMMGSGANPVTGDYSRGARGFWIENGKIAYPVSEMTIAGNIKDMWMRLTAANDLVHKYGVDAPTLRIEGMTVAGG